MSRAEAAPRPSVAVIGGGFSGAAVAYHLARRLGPGAAPILVVEPRETLGAGLAYSTAEPSHRINVPAGRMSLDTSEPDQFARWLAASGALSGDPAAFDRRGEAFPQRGLFGRYVAEMLAPFLAEGRIVHRRARAETVRRAASGAFEIALADGTRLESAIVVLAATHPLPAVPAPLAAIAAAPGFVADPYDPLALARIAPDARILVLGNGLTAADVVATLDRLGHRGRITTLSRNGLRSRGHAPVPVEPFGAFDRAPAGTALALLRRVRRTIAEAAAEGLSWHAALDAARGQGGAIWRALPEAERARLVRHLRSFWDVHRFRIAPQVEAVLDRLTRDGRLDSVAASLRDARPEARALAVTTRERRSGRLVTERFDAVVNTTGPAHRAVLHAAPFASLHAAGLVSLDRVGLGLATAEDGRAIGTDGRAVPDLLVAGPLARGTFGELMGLPQVTLYAEFVAEELARRLALPRPDAPAPSRLAS
ncbi:FAD-dependent oxidoreductase [Aureimonas endophytica]|uniref:FAD-dependent oxidoreductase n=1 Tax=Aureimonas endophytica TaxID=2027858 RepID=A0A916ZS14_9HYPH|nr:FAD/NAD(P)-binding protein [Aureimonas endophytica]GGE11298.1 FAD-dependent oxidoreductase [Aureimonas endophytica]